MGVGRLHVGVLGPFEVRIGGTVAGPAGAKRRGLLAVLALDANSVVPVSRLIDQLWGEEPPASAVNIVQTYVSAWRKALGSDPLVTVGTGYRLELGAAQSDLLSYRELVSQARVAEAEARHAEAARLLRDALRLWRGPALVDLSGEAFHDRLAGRLEIERLAATESWARAVLLSGGDPSEVAAELTAVQAREPLRETTTELLMWVHTAAGQQASALDAFSVTQRLLRTELGADPGPALAAMHERVLRADPTLQQRTPVVVAGPDARPDPPRERPGLVRRPRPRHASGLGASDEPPVGHPHRTRRRRKVTARGRGAPAAVTGRPARLVRRDGPDSRGRPGACHDRGRHRLAGLRRHRPDADPVRAPGRCFGAARAGQPRAPARRTPGGRRPAGAARATCRSCSPRASRCSLAGEQQYPVPLLAVPQAGPPRVRVRP